MATTHVYHAAEDSALSAFLDRHARLFVLTGAGCSTESGIPDYRDAAGNWKRAQPIFYQRFISDAAARRRYWARSMSGWQRIAAAAPNCAHRALARLEADGRVEHLVTQNVDGLHERAGSRRIIDLHGRIDRVRCIGCQRVLSRREFQRQLLERNPSFAVQVAAIAPDGDADLAIEDFERFDVPSCERCGGIYKSDVVFFGENVPRQRITSAMESLETADAMLVVGTSLMVYSAYRFVKAAARLGKPIGAVNLGRTRADELFALKLERPCTEALEFVLTRAGSAESRSVGARAAGREAEVGSD